MCIAAGSLNGAEPGGTASQTNIIAINVFQYFASNCGSSPSMCASSSSIISALDFVLTRVNAGHKVASVNMSLGVGLYSSATSCDASNPGYLTAITALRNAGVLVIASAGNSYATSQIGRPGCVSGSLSVGSSTDMDDISNFSNAANIMDMWAPGQWINAPVSSSDISYAIQWDFDGGSSGCGCCGRVIRLCLMGQSWGHIAWIILG